MGIIDYRKENGLANDAEARPGNTACFNKESVWTFPHDENGKLDFENGSYDEVELCTLKCKYNEEVRLSLGVVKNSQSSGENLAPFVYTNKTLISERDWKKKEKEAIERVLQLENPKNGGWIVVDPSTEGKIYQNDKLTVLKGLSEKREKRFVEVGVEKVVDILSLSESQIETITTKRGAGNGDVTKALLTGFINQAETCQRIHRPPSIDYRKVAGKNPFEARYGEQWKEEIAKSSACSRYLCIHKLIDHVYENTRKHFVGTKYEKNFYFYHDALSLMTSKDAIKYMKEKGIYKHWLLPEAGLFSKEHDPSLKRYQGRPVGNSPELMPLDSCLNRDIHMAVDTACADTAAMKDDDPKKFSMRTPKHGTSAYLRLLQTNVAIRIVQDIDLFPKAVIAISEAEGKLIPDLCARGPYGKRTAAFGQQEKRPQGGYRPRKKESDPKRIDHPDAKEGQLLKMKLSILISEGGTKEEQEKVKVEGVKL
ncbi:hypothetical protein CTEN210_09679 [Chaetoceros tenuissimus]|uniref:Uncharacterized protein n=1 Tax=Chaetoceros tenuissimus TaxID=426638 RepID=A0AAD3CWB6_9STRA|nr:hypothetical protein CTEN210_09679 [Chaetoceros tenuissimus]